MARIVRFHQTGGPEVLKIEQVEVPSPGPGEVRIAVKALGLNRAESMFRSGQYLEQPTFPARLGYEAAGTVEALGEGVQGLKVGDAVSTIPAFSQNQYGVYGDTAIVPAAAVAKHPASLSWAEAAAIWMQYLTAYGALIDIAGLKAGDTLLIPAASSSVGIAAIQIANMVGATPIALHAPQRQAASLCWTSAPPTSSPPKSRIWSPRCKRLTGGQRGPHRVRPGWRADRRQADSGDGPARHPVPVRRPQHRADAAAAVRRAWQVADHPRLRPLRDHERPGPSRAGASSS